jgi:DnaJ domain
VTSALAETTVLQACSTLFGLEPSICRGILFTLQPSGAKSAYRKKAKETHPDLFHDQDRAVQQRQAKLFREISDAYETLNRFIKEREKGLWSPSTHSASRPLQSASSQERTSRPQETPKKNRTDFYLGPIPFRVLDIGRYLYYSGLISYWSLIEALKWQRKQRPLIGSVAMQWGWLSAETIKQIATSNAINGRFGERAVRLGLLSSFQVNTLLYYQHTLQERLGTYFVQQHLLTAEQLELLASGMMKHNALVVARQKDESRGRNPHM